MTTTSPGSIETDARRWHPQPEAAAFVHGLVAEFCARSSYARNLAERMHTQTGTRLIDWIDHVALPRDEGLQARLIELGFSHADEDGPPTSHNTVTLRHAAGLFPTIRFRDEPASCLVIGVESVADFLVAHSQTDVRIEGPPLAARRIARVAEENDTQFWVVERHGWQGFDSSKLPRHSAETVLAYAEAFRRRRRAFETAVAGFEHAASLVRAAAADLGTDRACDLFFAAEREYWQRRNTAGRVQRHRQDALGLGWANHDHHTYRSSREHFTRLIAVLELLGFECRERFYGGREAGWGAQVLEQPRCGVVIFADVDLTPEEVVGDFAHEPLPVQSSLGTVGLWCRLHGEAFLEAGMHHLECRFDFDAARVQLRELGIETMSPFTDFTYLKQAFTRGERWPVDPHRIDAALADGVINAAQAEQFRQHGAIGSHLEILQRDDGYKGFNQSGISEIIARTDPRRQ